MLIFDSDTSRVCFEVSVIDDDRHELEESFDLVLTSDDDAVGIPDDTSVFTIEDDDGVWVWGCEGVLFVKVCVIYNNYNMDGLSVYIPGSCVYYLSLGMY